MTECKITPAKKKASKQPQVNITITNDPKHLALDFRQQENTP